jgi:hypothetical protein
MYNFDDCSLVYNTQTLTTYVKDVSGIKLNLVLNEFHPMGAVFPTPVDTGLRNADELTVTFMYDGGGAATPPTAAAVGTSATLTLTIGALQSVTGTFIVSSGEITIGTDSSHTYTAVFTPTGTVTWDVAA